MAKIDGIEVPNDLLSGAGVCELLNWKPKTLDTYSHQLGTFPEPTVVVGRSRLWERRVVVKWDKARPGKR